mmetsp:Transcript_35829/g.57561  ORF Transcript_35829/g.57561 Transcript_35829/m.57561 type:complete len:301 (-) Transcript_35829:96-998(-)
MGTRRFGAHRPWARSPPALRWVLGSAWNVVAKLSTQLREALKSDPVKDRVASVTHEHTCQPMLAMSTMRRLDSMTTIGRKRLQRAESSSRRRRRRPLPSSHQTKQGADDHDDHADGSVLAPMGDARRSRSSPLRPTSASLSPGAHHHDEGGGGGGNDDDDHQENGGEEGEAEKTTRADILDMHTNTRGTNLSGGFAQSVALARVFLRPEAQIVILDEALGQMDAIKRNSHVLPRLFEFVKKHNQTLVLVSHDLGSVAKRVDHIFVMDGGKCVQQGSHNELVRKQAREYVGLVGGEDVSST